MKENDLRRLRLSARLRRLRRCALFLFLAVALFQSPLDAQEPPKPLLWGADEEGGMPYVFKDNKLNRVGFEVDLAAALARELKRPIEFKQYPFDNLVPGLLKKDIDLAMNGLEITPERQQQVRFSKPYYVYRQQLVVRKDEDRFTTLKGCKELGGVVGTMDATASERLLDELKIAKRSYPSPTEAYSDLKIPGRLDAVLLDYP